MPHRSPTWLAARLLAFTALAATPTAADACSCGRTSIQEYFDAAEHVFVARITSLHDLSTATYAERLSPPEGWGWPDDDTYGLRMEFEAEHVVKGDPAAVPHLVTRYGGGDCGTPELPGKLLLVGVDDSGRVSYCGLTSRITGRLCREVHLLDAMKKRALDGATRSCGRKTTATNWGKDGT